MTLRGKKVAVLVENIYQELEFWYPYYRLREEKAEVVAVGPKLEIYTGKYGMPVKPERSIYDVSANDFDAVVIPGGYAPDLMRRTPEMVEFVRKMHTQGKIVAAICHAGWMLVSADIIDGKKVTSFYSIGDDLVNAGAEWLDQEVVIDKNIITSRNPNDLPAFCRAIIAALSK